MLEALRFMYGNGTPSPKLAPPTHSTPKYNDTERRERKREEEEDEEDDGECPCSLVEEDWESSDDEFTDGRGSGSGQGKRLLFDKLEETRANLEERLGLDNLLQAYTVVKVHMYMYLSLSLSLSLPLPPSLVSLPPFSEHQLSVLIFFQFIYTHSSFLLSLHPFTRSFKREKVTMTMTSALVHYPQTLLSPKMASL